MVRKTRGIRRVLAVTAVALWSFVGAIVALADDARRGCVVEAPVDPAYTASLLGEITLERNEHEIAVFRDGRPLSGAKVCAVVYMVGMQAMGSSDDAAEETAPGIYRLTVSFLMSGGWEGAIQITENGKQPVSVNLRFDVV